MQVLTSFAELAKVMGSKVKAKKVMTKATWLTVNEKCGRKAAMIWAFLNDQEACPRYGAKGEILHDMKQLQTVTGYDESQVFGAVVSLIRHNFAKPTANGKQVRAA